MPRRPSVSRDGLESRREFRVKFAVHQYIQYAARLAGAIAPGVIGAALDDDVPGLEQHVFVVQQKREFAFRREITQFVRLRRDFRDADRPCPAARDAGCAGLASDRARLP